MLFIFGGPLLLGHGVTADVTSALNIPKSDWQSLYNNDARTMMAAFFLADRCCPSRFFFTNPFVFVLAFYSVGLSNVSGALRQIAVLRTGRLAGPTFDSVKEKPKTEPK